METQNTAILEHLLTGRAIDPMTALKKFACMRLGARIYDLKRMGIKIISERKTVNNRFGSPCKISIYKLDTRGMK